jgi:hypothetical protein
VSKTTTRSNQETNEEETLTEPVNNVCRFNDYENALQRKNKDKTYNGY